MEELYKKILAKPKSYRRKLVYILTFAFGIIILSLWLILTTENFKNTVGEIEKSSNFKKELPSLKEKYQEQVDENQEIENELEEIEN
jgi:hypothetical protein